MYRVFLGSPVFIRLSLLLALLLTTACVPNAAPSLGFESSEPADVCPAITTVTSVQILLPPSAAPRKNAYLITDPEAVRKLVAFVNLRRNASPPSADTPPTPKLRATFYYGSRNVAIFGSGTGVFYLQCGTARGTRYASAAEITEFELLIAPPNAGP
jgi:hypothetical protein